LRPSCHPAANEESVAPGVPNIQSGKISMQTPPEINGTDQCSEIDVTAGV
jgi:hypothetical protein